MNALQKISIATTSLPQSYEAAKTALATCARIDECKEWADKAAALASYAKQAEDDQLLKLAKRIKARALRRAGELLKQIEPSQGGRPPETQEGARPSLSRSQAARDAGMSEHQQKQAQRVAAVPQEQFDEMVESDAPPTTTKLAEIGTAKKPTPSVDLGGRDPKAFNRALHFVALFERYADDLSAYDIGDVLTCLDEDDRGRVRAAVSKIDVIHDQLITRI